MKKYQITILKSKFDEVLKSKTKIYQIKFDEQIVSFKCNNIKNIENIESIIIKNKHKNLFMKIIKNHCITIIGLILFIAMNLVLQKTITKIEFINKDYYNQEVYDYVSSKLNTHYKFAFLNQNINEINKDLRTTFYKYQWIGLVKEGSVIYIDIAKTQDVDEEEKKDKTPGGLYSRFDCIISNYYISKGKVLVKPNMSINKGDELVSGILELYGGELEFVHADGYVIGEVVEYKNVEILKEEVKKVRTGKIEIQKKHLIFSNKIEKIKCGFENFEFEIKEIYKIGNFYTVYKVFCYEVKTTKTFYDLDSAKAFSLSKVKNNFIANKVNEKEYIIEINFISFEEDDHKYYFKYLQKANIVVSEFIPYQTD